LGSVDGAALIGDPERMPRRSRPAAIGSSGDDLRRIALAMPAAVETLTWGEPHFRIHNKIFCGLGIRDGREVTSVKLEKAHAEARLLDPRFRPAPYVGRYGWVEVGLEEVSPEELAALLEESYRLVARGRRPGTRRR
jgi:predicted DNA-binding protein (MmcQ/YjbR family)